jgi:hypothetical protein
MKVADPESETKYRKTEGMGEVKACCRCPRARPRIVHLKET